MDMHTHLAMGWLRPLAVDLQASTPTVDHYLPLTQPLDLDPYSNENIDDSSMFAMKADLSILGLTDWGKRVAHTAPGAPGIRFGAPARPRHRPTPDQPEG